MITETDVVDKTIDLTETDTFQITVRLYQDQIITITGLFQGSKETEISDKTDFLQAQDKPYTQEVQCRQEVQHQTEQQHQMEDSVAEDKDVFTKRKNIWDNLNWGYPIFMFIS